MKAFLPAILLGLLNLALAPFVGVLRDWLFETFPGSAVKGLAIAAAALGVVVMVAALARIRHHRGWRYGGLLLVVALVLLQSFGLGRASAEVDVVEKFHFVQYGLLAFLVYRGLGYGRVVGQHLDGAAFLLPILWAGIAGTLDEWVQWLVPVRTGDGVDVLLNLYAGVCGTLLALVAFPPTLPWRRMAPCRRQGVALAAALAVLVAAGFVHCAHLAYPVKFEAPDGTEATFRSLFTEEDLLTAQQRRAREWPAEPPTLEVLAIEDRYLAEAGWHVHGRNAALHREDWTTAWFEAQILARFYAPFLDIPPLPGTGNYRLHPQQTQQIEEGYRALGDRGGKIYSSPVLTNRYILWPGGKVAFWISAGALSLALLALAIYLGRERGGGDGSSGGT